MNMTEMKRLSTKSGAENVFKHDQNPYGFEAKFISDKYIKVDEMKNYEKKKKELGVRDSMKIEQVVNPQPTQSSNMDNTSPSSKKEEQLT